MLYCTLGSSDKPEARPGQIHSLTIRRLCIRNITPSTRFDSSNGTFPAAPSSPAVMIPSKESPQRPSIIVPDALKANPNHGHPSPVPPVWCNVSPISSPLAPQPFLSRSLRSMPSLGTLTQPVPRGVSPAFSESSIISSLRLHSTPTPALDLPPPSDLRLCLLARYRMFHLITHTHTLFPKSGVDASRRSQRRVSFLFKT